MIEGIEDYKQRTIERSARLWTYQDIMSALDSLTWENKEPLSNFGPQTLGGFEFAIRKMRDVLIQRMQGVGSDTLNEISALNNQILAMELPTSKGNGEQYLECFKCSKGLDPKDCTTIDGKFYCDSCRPFYRENGETAKGRKA